MADPQDRPDNPPDTAAQKSPKQPPPAMSPHKAAKKTPAKKPPAKGAKKVQQASEKSTKKSQQAESKKTPARKAAGKKAAAKKAPLKKAAPTAEPNGQPPTPPRIGANGQLASAAKDAAARAKSTVDKASNPVSRDLSRDEVLPSAARSPVSMLVAVAVSLLALVLVCRLRRRPR